MLPAAIRGLVAFAICPPAPGRRLRHSPLRPISPPCGLRALAQSPCMAAALPFAWASCAGAGAAVCGWPRRQPRWRLGGSAATAPAWAATLAPWPARRRRFARLVGGVLAAGRCALAGLAVASRHRPASAMRPLRGGGFALRLCICRSATARRRCALVAALHRPRGRGMAAALLLSVRPRHRPVRCGGRPETVLMAELRSAKERIE